MIDANIVAKWIWDNDFKPIVGQKFQFRAEANEWWDGIADGEVLAVNEPNHLKYTWASQSESTTITWTLHGEFDGKTHLHFEQSGFSEETKAYPGALSGAKSSWEEFARRLEKVVA